MSEQNKVALDVELLDAKPVKALRKIVGDGGVKDFVTQTDEELKAVISSCTMAIMDAKRKVEKNHDYIDAKSVQDDFKAGLRAQSAPLKKKIAAAAFVLGTRKDALRGS